MKKTQPPIISAIVAMATNRVIGNAGQLPWHLPADLKHFKALTTGHAIIMGRKTYESIGKPLPNRTNIIITRNPTYQAPHCYVFTTIEAAIQHAATQTNDEIFMIGGAEVYQQSLPLLSRIYLTIVHHTATGDTYFPTLDPNEWHEIERKDLPADEKNAYPYSFLTLDRMPAPEQHSEKSI